MFISKFIKFAVASLLMVAFTAQAEVVIQSAQYKGDKGALYVKGTVGSAGKVYVVDSDTDDVIGEVNAKGKQFRADITISEADVPCMVQIQTNKPSSGGGWGGWGSWGQTSSATDPGEFSVAPVRHSPNCSK